MNNSKKNWPNFSNFKTTLAGQVSRNNLELKNNKINYKKKYILYLKIYTMN